MRKFTKRYTVTDFAVGMSLHDLFGIIDTTNRRKFGKHRRGTVTCLGITADRNRDGTITISVEFATGVPSFAKIVGGPRFRVRGISDFRKPLRKLGSNQI